MRPDPEPRITTRHGILAKCHVSGQECHKRQAHGHAHHLAPDRHSDSHRKQGRFRLKEIPAGLRRRLQLAAFTLHPIPHYHGAYLCHFDIAEPLGFRSRVGIWVTGLEGMKSWDKEGRRRGGGVNASLASSSRHSPFYNATAALEDRCGCHASALWARIGHGSRWHAEGGCGKGHRCTVDLLGRNRGPAAADGNGRDGIWSKA